MVLDLAARWWARTRRMIRRTPRRVFRTTPSLTLWLDCRTLNGSFHAHDVKAACRTPNDLLELLASPVDVEHRKARVGAEEQRKAVRSDLDIGGIVGVRARHVDARKVDFDVRHLSPLLNHHMPPAGEQMAGMEHVTPEPREDVLPPNPAALAGRAAALALAFEPIGSRETRSPRQARPSGRDARSRQRLGIHSDFAGPGNWQRHAGRCCSLEPCHGFLGVRREGHRSTHSTNAGGTSLRADHDAQDAVVPQQRRRTQPRSLERRVARPCSRQIVEVPRLIVVISLNIF